MEPSLYNVRVTPIDNVPPPSLTKKGDQPEDPKIGTVATSLGRDGSSSKVQGNISRQKIEKLEDDETKKMRKSFSFSGFVTAILSFIRKAVSYLNIFAYFNIGKRNKEEENILIASRIVKSEEVQPVKERTPEKQLSDAARRLMTYFEENDQNFKEEGVFRTSGDVKTITDLVENLKKDPSYPLEDSKLSTPDMASALKKLFGEMKLFGKEELEKEFLQTCSTIEGKSKKEEIVNSLKKLIEQLSADQKQDLKQMVKILSLVAQNEEFNKMGFPNLGIVFGPRLYDGKEALSVVSTRNFIAEKLIEYHQEIFG